MQAKDIPVIRSSLPSYEKYTVALRELWDTRILTNMAKYHNLLEEKLRNFLGVNCFRLFTNGHIALETALQNMGLSGEVITTPFTFASTTHAIARSGLKPVFCDISYDDYNIDVSKIEELINEKTSQAFPYT